MFSVPATPVGANCISNSVKSTMVFFLYLFYKGKSSQESNGLSVDLCSSTRMSISVLAASLNNALLVPAFEAMWAAMSLWISSFAILFLFCDDKSNRNLLDLPKLRILICLLCSLVFMMQFVCSQTHPLRPSHTKCMKTNIIIQTDWLYFLRKQSSAWNLIARTWLIGVKETQHVAFFSAKYRKTGIIFISLLYFPLFPVGASQIPNKCALKCNAAKIFLKQIR